MVGLHGYTLLLNDGVVDNTCLLLADFFTICDDRRGRRLNRVAVLVFAILRNRGDDDIVIAWSCMLR